MHRCLHFEQLLLWFKSNQEFLDRGGDSKMYCKVNKCCFCCSLRWGIILFAYINVLFSLFAATCLVITTEMDRVALVNDTSLEMVTATILFAILGMGIILNIMLLVAGYQKDIQMLKLYNYYSVATTLAALVPTLILLSRLRVVEVVAATFAMVLQCYVIMLVRSEILKLEKRLTTRRDPEAAAVNEAIVVVPDTTTLL